MLRISFYQHRNFELECPLEKVEAHFSNFEQMLEDFPALKVIKVWGAHQYRIAYSANITGVYQVDLVSDVQARYDTQGHSLIVSPSRGHPAVAAQSTMRSLTGQGDYSSRLILHDLQGRTLVDYELSVVADIHKPVRLRQVPDSLARVAIQAVVKHRIQNMTDLFIARTVSRLSR